MDHGTDDRRAQERRAEDAERARCSRDCQEKILRMETKLLVQQVEATAKLSAVEGAVSRLESALSTYVTQAQFTPVKLLVYGGVTGVCMGVVNHLLEMIFK